MAIYIFLCISCHVKLSNYFWRSKELLSLPLVLVPSCTWYHYHPPSLNPPIPTCLPPSYPCCSLTSPSGTRHVSPLLLPLSILYSVWLSLILSSPATFPPFLSAYLSSASSTYHYPCGSLRTPPSLSLSTFWHSMCRWWTSFCVPSAPFPPLPLPSSRPTYSTGAHHTCRRAQTWPRAVSTVLGRSTLCCSSTAGGVAASEDRTGRGWQRSPLCPLCSCSCSWSWRGTDGDTTWVWRGFIVSE